MHPATKKTDAKPAPSPSARAVASKPHVFGLDSLRFLAAIMVAVDHLRPIPVFHLTPATPLWMRAVIGVFLGGWWFCGPGAVIVFFVISGFCIHYPFRDGSSPRVIEFYSRRFVRILIPALIASAIAGRAGVGLDLFGESILWSLVAEMIYYALYPWLLPIARRIGWVRLISFGFAAAIAVAWTNPTGRNYPSYGHSLNWLLGLPCWLLGCLLAQRHAPSEVVRGNAPTMGALYLYRVGILLSMIVLMLARFHTPAGYPHTLNYWAVLVYFWLRKELVYQNVHRSFPRWLERAGKWSYSLYLMHVPAGAVLIAAGFGAEESVAIGTLHYAAVFSTAFLFHLLVEKPSHRLGRYLGNLAGRSFRA